MGIDGLFENFRLIKDLRACIWRKLCVGQTVLIPESVNQWGKGGNLTPPILSIYNYYYSPIDFLRREYPTYNTFPCIFIGLLLHFSPTEVGHSSTSLIIKVQVLQLRVLSVGKETPARY
jgi:hypothetical protein